ncbi:MAG: GerMN domain-containing protein [Longimicrobiales bacterium]|nr:GerMN domain-containing protein [Longimicrobiales bacterium]
MRASGAMAAALLLLVGCERPESRPSVETGRDSVPSAAPTNESPAPEQTAESPLSADLRTALERLLRGPTAPPQTAGAHSWFSRETADALRSATVDSTGHATVDFNDLRPLIPNASSSAGSASLLEELNSTVFRFPGIRSVEYRMEGSCDRFWEWLQYECHRVMRD